MRLVHLADTHLGHRQLQRSDARGTNQRERDVSETLTRVITQTIAIAPDLVVIAGDVFHNVTPPNGPLIHLYAELARLRAALPSTIVIMIAGNHDEPRAQERECVLPIFRHLGCHVVHTHPERLVFPGVSVLCVPEKFAHRTTLKPDPNAERNVLLLHGEIAGAIPKTRVTEVTIDPERFASGWDYVALGHYHVTTEVAPGCWYAGSIDYTSTDPWGELKEEAARGLEGKGLLEVDLDTHAVTRHSIAPSRRWVNLPAVDARGMTAEAVDAAIAANLVAAGDLTGAIVRQVVTNTEKDQRSDLRIKKRRDLLSPLLDFNLDTRAAERAASAMSMAPEDVKLRADRRRRTVSQVVGDWFDQRLPVDGAVADNDELKAIVLKQLADIDASEDLTPILEASVDDITPAKTRKREAAA
jgi:exonuclease SbcD